MVSNTVAKTAIFTQADYLQVFCSSKLALLIKQCSHSLINVEVVVLAFILLKVCRICRCLAVGWSTWSLPSWAGGLWCSPGSTPCPPRSSPCTETSSQAFLTGCCLPACSSYAKPPRQELGMNNGNTNTLYSLVGTVTVTTLLTPALIYWEKPVSSDVRCWYLDLDNRKPPDLCSLCRNIPRRPTPTW